MEVLGGDIWRIKGEEERWKRGRIYQGRNNGDLWGRRRIHKGWVVDRTAGQVIHDMNVDLSIVVFLISLEYNELGWMFIE